MITGRAEWTYLYFASGEACFCVFEVCNDAEVIGINWFIIAAEYVIVTARPRRNAKPVTVYNSSLKSDLTDQHHQYLKGKKFEFSECYIY